MLKTTVDETAKPNALLLSLSILRAYLKHPVWFLFTTLLTIPKFKKRLPKDLPNEFIRVSIIPILFYLRLKKKIGQEKAYEVVRVMVLSIGTLTMQGFFRNVEAPRTFVNLVKYQQLTNKLGPTRWNKMEILEQSDSRYEFRVHNCMFHELYSYLGIPEMTKIMCGVDNIIFNSYLPEKVIFHRNGTGNRIADGAPSCHFVIENHEHMSA